MHKTEIEFSKNTLYINIEGIINKKNIQSLKKKVFYIIDEYNINNIVVDIRKMKTMDQDAFYDFLDDYDIEYGGNLEVVE